MPSRLLRAMMRNGFECGATKGEHSRAGGWRPTSHSAFPHPLYSGRTPPGCSMEAMPMCSPSIGRVNTTRPSLGFSFLPPPPSLALISPPIPWVTAPGADVGWKNNSSPAVGDGEGGGGGGGGEPTREPEGVVGRGGGLGDAPHQEGRGRGGEWGCAAPARGGGTDRAAAAPSGGTWGVRGHGDSVGIGGYGERGG